ncbi:2-hydroxyacid dehydrogenase [Aliiglaciecola sp. 2_MG-2023]|uniref:2-hydroxyacid dehydrogenase n=1 Tax=unclassified Aliiglaciecola TaxID=2593648 RepID=UPI0026E1FFC6|nr:MULTISPECIES: 2-hydroxyacid dehydrogenase [unclassified Aliiglaciecola]MDO6712242.1 2-hydroxyacid dehydrogenase [Aliiglaciecola sp. 2_MG-2023]MDO6753520.1 2-hydroxyacid dehydrogenase [Aliiglaciecola sp. 1_MG-2023]
MKTLFFSSKSHDISYFNKQNTLYNFTLDFQEARLSIDTVALCQGYEAICIFVNDQVDSQVIEQLKEMGIKHIALRCAGFNNVDLQKAKQLGIRVSRVPAYSPEAVAEHTVALMMTLNRKLHKAYNRVRENNFSLNGLIGFNFHGKTAGIVGYGKIGKCTANILLGLGCKVICYDPMTQTSDQKDITFVSLDTLLCDSDIISLHCPLTNESQHMINDDSISKMKDGVMLINTSRGGLVDSKAVIRALKSRKIGQLGLDVYEMESDLFFEDKSWEIMQDDVFDRLVGFPNVLITGHQGFFTDEALQQIAQTTLNNIALMDKQQSDPHTFLV